MAKSNVVTKRTVNLTLSRNGPFAGLFLCHKKTPHYGGVDKAGKNARPNPAPFLFSESARVNR